MICRLLEIWCLEFAFFALDVALSARSILILGSGCARCEKLANNARAAAEELGIAFTLEKTGDLARIADFGVLMTPALVVDGNVLSAGKVLRIEEIMAMLK